jgi:hypothetical protein
MQRFLFQYIQLFSFIGAGTPEEPGGDFDMHCWIEAPDKAAALEWGFILLGDYCKARYAYSADGHRHDGSPIQDGEIVEDPGALAAAVHWGIPACSVGEVPKWREPWRVSNIREKAK